MSNFKRLLEWFPCQKRRGGTYQRLPDLPAVSPRPDILRLPAELLMEILEYLPSVSEACLALTCKTICSRIGTKSWYLLKGKCSHADDTTRTEVFRLLHLLRRDAPNSHWLCFSCISLHPIPKSSSQRMRKHDFCFHEEWHTHAEVVRPSTDCAMIPHGIAKSYMRHYLLPRIREHFSSSRGQINPELALKDFSWWGYLGLPYVDPTDQVWQRFVGQTSYLGLVKISTIVGRSKAVVLRFYKYRAAAKSWAYHRLALDICDHHFLAPSSSEMNEHAPELTSSWRPTLLSDDGTQQALQLNQALQGPGSAYAIRCSQCATQLHWSCPNGPYTVVHPPFSAEPFVGIVVAHTVEGNSAFGSADQQVDDHPSSQPSQYDGWWGSPWQSTPNETVDSEDAKLRQQARGQILDFFDLHFSWQVGWRTELAGRLDVEEARRLELNFHTIRNLADA